MRSRLKLVVDEPTERVFGSHGFIALSRNPALQSPKRFEPTVKGENDVII
jgi:hypothetical protein